MWLTAVSIKSSKMSSINQQKAIVAKSTMGQRRSVSCSNPRQKISAPNEPQRQRSASKLSVPLNPVPELTNSHSAAMEAIELPMDQPSPAMPERISRERRRVLALLEPDDDPNRILQEYPFKAKSLAFRTNYDNSVAKSYVWVPRTTDTFHALLVVISQAVAFLGFDEVTIGSSYQALYSAITCTVELEETGLDLDESRLSLLWIRPPEYAWSQLRNYIVYRQVDSSHDGIINKWLLIANLQWIDHRILFKTAEGHQFSSKYFLPETINLGRMPMDEMISLMAASDGTYIIKDVRGTKGQNIRLLRLGGGHIGKHRDLLDLLKSAGLLSHRMSDVIIQKYIDQPLLVDKRKFDFRVYMLMVNACRSEKSGARSKAFYVYWHPGFLRLCIMAYQHDSDDLLCHLTNQNVQMGSVLYDRFKETTVWEPDELNQYFNSRDNLPEKNYVRDTIYPKIGAIIGYLGAAFASNLNDGAIQANTFKVFGVDFMVDSDLSVKLIEVNDLPSWQRQTRVLFSLKADLWREAIALTVETVSKFRRRQPLEPLLSQCNFRLVHSSENPSLLAESIAKLFH